jgi:hypothetical protein
MILRDARKNIKYGPGHKEHALDLPFWRDNNKLWALPINAEQIDVEELSWMMSVPFWEDENGDIVVTPNEVLANPKKFPDHTNLIDTCDTSYPIHITKNKFNEWIILDGLHRLAKLIREGRKKLMVKKVTMEQVWMTKREE